MNIQLMHQRNFFFTILLCFLFYKSNAQPLQIQTYFEISKNYYPHSLVTNGNGEFYFVEDSYPSVVKKVSDSGVLSTFLEGNFYIDNPRWNMSSSSNIAVNNENNLIFIDNYEWPGKIKKSNSDGDFSDYINGNYYPRALASDFLGNIFFIDERSWPYTINKIDNRGNVTILIDEASPYRISEIIVDSNGNLIFIDENTNNSIYKISSDNTISLLYNNTSNFYYIKSIAADSTGNIYVLNQSTYPNTISKINGTGDISLYAENTEQIQEIERIITDKNGNLFFLGKQNDMSKIFTVINPNYFCEPHSAPNVISKTVCSPGILELAASGVGQLKWFDAIGGNLLATGNNFTTPLLESTTSYFVQSELCGLNSYSELVISFEVGPVVSISGTITNNDFVTLTASGDAVSYLWSGGSSTTSATNYFTSSGNYSVTITNQYGCTDTKSFTITVNKLAVTSTGSLTPAFSQGLNQNGKTNDLKYLNRYGKLSNVTGADGLLNYEIFKSPASYPNNSLEFFNYVLPINLFEFGVKESSVLLDWNNMSQLTDAGISIPNGGDRFSVILSGFFIPSETGTYLFTCEGDDAVDLFINNANVANHYGGHGIGGLGSHIGTIALTAGIKYTFRARMQENGGGEGLRVYWKKPSNPSQWVIDQAEIGSE